MQHAEACPACAVAPTRHNCPLPRRRSCRLSHLRPAPKHSLPPPPLPSPPTSSQGYQPIARTLLPSEALQTKAGYAANEEGSNYEQQWTYR